MSNDTLSFREGLYRARSHVIFLLGLAVAFGLIFWLETAVLPSSSPISSERESPWSASVLAPAPDPTAMDTIPPVRARPLTESDRRLAKAAWRYFESNYQPKSGLFNSVHQYPYTTMWDLGSSLLGLVSAEQIGIISHAEFATYVERLLASLRDMSLYNNELPGRVVRIDRPRITEEDTRLNREGSGWSAVDLGRLLVALRAVYLHHHEFRPEVTAVLDKWQAGRLIDDGALHGAEQIGSEESYHQEGRHGFEQYAAAGVALWGGSAPESEDFVPVDTVEIEGIALPVDPRPIPLLTSDPFYLAALEIGAMGQAFDQYRNRLYAVQEARARQTRTLVAMGEDALDRPPWFAYSNVWFGGQAWQVVDSDGTSLPMDPPLSTKAALAWSVLYPNSPYSRRLRGTPENLISPYGVYTGLYSENEINRSLNVNTNAVILEVLAYKSTGRPILKGGLLYDLFPGPNDTTSSATEALAPLNPALTAEETRFGTP